LSRKTLVENDCAADALQGRGALFLASSFRVSTTAFVYVGAADCIVSDAMSAPSFNATRHNMLKRK
jgi:hypothetical protein